MSVRLGRWDSSSQAKEILAQDLATGAPSGFCRQYLPLTQSYTGSYINFAFLRNRIPIIAIHSWTDQPRHSIPWSAVASGMYDDVIMQNALDFKAMPGRSVPAYIVFHHEPENEEDGKVSGDLPAGETCGTKGDFIAAATRFRAIIRSVLSLDDALFGITLMAGSYRSGRWQSWVPPTYHFLGIDGYNHGTTKETFTNIFSPAHDAAVQAGKSLLIEEAGCEEVPGEQAFKADYFTDMRALAKTWPELIGICYSNVKAKGDYTIQTTPQSLAAWKAMAQDPYYTGAWS